MWGQVFLTRVWVLGFRVYHSIPFPDGRSATRSLILPGVPGDAPGVPGLAREGEGIADVPNLVVLLNHLSSFLLEDDCSVKQKTEVSFTLKPSNPQIQTDGIKGSGSTQRLHSKTSNWDFMFNYQQNHFEQYLLESYGKCASTELNTPPNSKRWDHMSNWRCTTNMPADYTESQQPVRFCWEVFLIPGSNHASNSLLESSTDALLILPIFWISSTAKFTS